MISRVGVGVQVGGSWTWVAVGDGTMIVGGSVGSGNGLSEESGLIKIARMTIAIVTVAAATNIVRMSQTESFMIIPPLIMTSVDGILSV